MLDNTLTQWISSHLGTISSQELNLLSAAHNHFVEHRTVELSKDAFDDIHGKRKQKLLGIAYTPKQVREELTKVVINKLAASKQPNAIQICDPCCGSGTFSLTLIEEFEKYGIPPAASLKNNIFLSDIDKVSVCLAMVNIALYLGRRSIDYSKILLNVKIEDFLTANTRYDGFVTNPPYVKLQNLPTETRDFLKNKYSDLFKGSLGLSSIFMKKMFDDLNDDGVLGVITQNNFFTSVSGSQLRKEIQNHLHKIDTFGSKPVFEGVTAYTCLLYVSKNVEKTFSYRKIDSKHDIKSTPSIILNSKLNYQKWRLGSQDELLDLEALEREGTPLNVACRIWVGIATNFDKAFTVHKVGNRWVGLSPEGEEYIIEDDIVKPLIKVADLNGEDCIRSNSRGIIYPYNLHGTKVYPIDEDILRNECSNAYAYLKSWENQLLSRQKGNVAQEDWYKWGRVQSMIPVKGKLLTKTFNKGPSFYFDSTDSLFSNGYALTIIHDGYDLEFVRRVLNGQIFEYYAKLTSFEIEGEYQCYQKNFIERFCLPNIGIGEQQKLLSENRIDKFLVDYFSLNYNPCVS